MKVLYVIRHGIAESAVKRGSDDERPLTAKGRDEIKSLARYLKGSDIRLTAVLSSPLARSIETAEIIREQCASRENLVITDLLEPDASYDDLIDYLDNMGDTGSVVNTGSIIDTESIMIVGHEPFLSGFISYCLSSRRQPFVRMEKGGIAALAYDDRLKPGGCVLLWLMSPSQIKA